MIGDVQRVAVEGKPAGTAEARGGAEAVRDAARSAGTLETRVEMTVEDNIAPLADGTRIFLGRSVEARLVGAPARKC